MINVEKLLTGPVNGLSYIKRFSIHPVTEKESVAEHSYYVGLYSLMIAMDLIQSGFPVDLGQLFIKTTTHDLDEAMTGDVIRSFKYSTPTLHGEMVKATETVVQGMFNDLNVSAGGAKSLYKHWIDSKDDTIEGKIVSVSDLLSVLSYSMRQIDLGNTRFYNVLEEAIGYLDILCKKEISTECSSDDHVCSTWEYYLIELMDEVRFLFRKSYSR